jgi:hypothetical protein
MRVSLGRLTTDSSTLTLKPAWPSVSGGIRLVDVIDAANVRAKA